jgi:hypothetical protein
VEAAAIERYRLEVLGEAPAAAPPQLPPPVAQLAPPLASQRDPPPPAAAAGRAGCAGKVCSRPSFSVSTVAILYTIHNADKCL